MTSEDNKVIYLCAISGVVAAHMPRHQRTPITKTIRGFVHGNISSKDVGTVLKFSAGKDVLKKSITWMKIKKKQEENIWRYSMHTLGKQIMDKVIPKCAVCKTTIHPTLAESNMLCTQNTCKCNRPVCCNELCSECKER